MAKNVLFYFTGTGNSLAVAKTVVAGLGDTLLVPMLGEHPVAQIDSQTERIGIVFPVHINAVPRVVINFLNKLPKLPSCYMFAIATHGGVPGFTGAYLNRHVKKRGLILDAYYEIPMINNTPKGIAPKMMMNLEWEKDLSPEQIDRVLRQSDALAQSVVESVLNKETTSLQNVPTGKARVQYFLMKLIWLISEQSNHKLRFILDECCNGCGVCEKVCTTGRIRIQEEKPEWIHENCSFCYACFNFCPEQAIGVEHYTKRLGRYHHPEITAGEISRQTAAD